MMNEIECSVLQMQVFGTHGLVMLHSVMLHSMMLCEVVSHGGYSGCPEHMELLLVNAIADQ